MQERFFSIIVVALNPGRKLRDTLKSVLEQTFTDYEIIIKDGGSTDGSPEDLRKDGFFERYPQIRMIQKEDRGIYDGMNQALAYAHGRFVQFLNCGDLLYGKDVLWQIAEAIEEEEKTEECTPCIYYGDQYHLQQRTGVASPPVINDFTCYRNVPCHQICFYDRRLFGKRGYDLRYRVRADYEHFLYSIYEEKARGKHLGITVVSYEGGGFSETVQNRRKSAAEHKEITLRYLGKKKVRKYRAVMWLTLAPLRTRIAENPHLAGLYQRLKKLVYKRH
ncbi:MAG: glycosyltransferase [Lachnospiraceae bacterium]|nr:glycosyltransferase [Lachnospiraceae bacterium]